MRRLAPLALVFVLAGCSDNYTAPSLYMATTPECKTWAEGSTFQLPRGITVSATAPTTRDDGGVEFGIIYMVPRGNEVQFTSRAFKISQPKGEVIAPAEVVSIYQRGTNQRADLVEVIKEVPLMMISVGTSDETQFRYSFRYAGKLPERFDVTPPTTIIRGNRYPVRTFTYRYFADRKAYGLCT